MLMIRSAARPSPPGELMTNAKPLERSIFCRTPSSIAASVSSIITGYRKLVKNETTGRPSSFASFAKSGWRVSCAWVCSRETC